MAKLSKTVMEDIEDVMSKYDRVGDKKIEVNDIVNVLRALDFNPASDDWDEVIQDYKDKKISRIDINEFAAIYEEESHRKTASFKELVEGLKCIDPMNGENGTVSRPILTRFLTVVGDKISDADAEKIMSTALEKGGKLVNIDKIVKQVMGPVE